MAKKYTDELTILPEEDIGETDGILVIRAPGGIVLVEKVQNEYVVIDSIPHHVGSREVETDKSRYLVLVAEDSEITMLELEPEK